MKITNWFKEVTGRKHEIPMTFEHYIIESDFEYTILAKMVIPKETSFEKYMDICYKEQKSPITQYLGRKERSANYRRKTYGEEEVIYTKNEE